MDNDFLNDSRFIEELRNRSNSGERFEYVFFWGHQPGKNKVTTSCFSQWYEASFTIDGVHYSTAEHFMMAEKAALFDDSETRSKVIAATTPAEAKALGRQVRGFNDAQWTAKRFSIVVQANSAKFSQNAELGSFLKNTAPKILVEASPVDRIWGIGLAQNAEKISNPNHWRGLNLLGFALMQVRDCL